MYFIELEIDPERILLKRESPTPVILLKLLRGLSIGRDIIMRNFIEDKQFLLKKYDMGISIRRSGRTFEITAINF